MKINQPSAPVGASISPLPSASAGAPQSVAKPAATELRSSAARQALKASSEVDMEKVQQVKRAIAEGRLSLDPQVLAEAVLDLHQR